uniref:Uncharacterized protein n=1 Tax=Halomonas phage vB_HboP_4908 TaxID=3350578 RepID=A0AB74UR42_9VIRU
MCADLTQKLSQNSPCIWSIAQSFINKTIDKDFKTFFFHIMERRFELRLFVFGPITFHNLYFDHVANGICMKPHINSIENSRKATIFFKKIQPLGSNSIEYMSFSILNRIVKICSSKNQNPMFFKIYALFINLIFRDFKFVSKLTLIHLAWVRVCNIVQKLTLKRPVKPHIFLHFLKLTIANY